MGNDNTNKAARSAYYARRRLIEQMGGRCARCGADEDESGYAMEFHHPNGRDWSVRKTNRWVRIALYRRDWLAGNLELNCRPCNGRDSWRFRRRKKGGVQ